MGKRSDFKRVPQDRYDTPWEAVEPLLPHLLPGTRFVEPAAGARTLVEHLEHAGHICVRASDVMPRSNLVKRQDFLSMTRADVVDANMVITNPPWDRKLLHALILHLRDINIPAWLLIDANWMFTMQAAPFMSRCVEIVTVGRVIWIPGTTMTGKDDAAWFHFMPTPVNRTLFWGKQDKHTQVLNRGTGAPARAAARM